MLFSIIDDFYKFSYPYAHLYLLLTSLTMLLSIIYKFERHCLYFLFFAFSFILEFWCVSVRSNFRALFILGKEKRNWNHYFTWFLIFNPLHGKSTATFLNHFRLQKNKNLGAQNHYMVLNYFLMAKATTF